MSLDDLVADLRRAAQKHGFVGDEAESKLQEAAEIILGDPRTQEILDGREDADRLLEEGDEEEEDPAPEDYEQSEADFLIEVASRLEHLPPNVSGLDQYHTDRLRELAAKLRTKPTTVTCKLCKKDTPAATAHMHQSAYVGECCWDDRLKASE